MKNIFRIALCRTISQIRFRPTLAWFSDRANCSSVLEPAYTEWRSDKNGNIALFSPKNQEALEIYTNQITYITELEDAENRPKSHVLKIINKAIKDDGVGELRRIGYRSIAIYSSTINFDEIVDLLSKKLFSNSEKLSLLHGDSVSDSAYIVDSKHDTLISHVSIGAMKKTQADNVFSTQFDNFDNLKDDNNLFLDIDVSITDGLKANELDGIYSKVISLEKKLREGYLNYLMQG